MKNYIFKIFIFVITASFLGSCTDPYVLQSNNFEEALVIEATITNELKHQEIKITKTYKLEATGPTTVSDAVVILKDNLGNTFEFAEQGDKYLSIDEFKAEPNREYQLKIITDDGRSYVSTTEVLTHVTPIQDVLPTVTTKNGEKGVDMVVNSFDPTNSSKYYRYEYEETNKIISPKWVPIKGIGTFVYDVFGNVGGVIDLVPRTIQAQICYNTKKSDQIILTSTNELSEDKVNYSVRFIRNNDYIIANRYSIFVKQYVQNLASYTYHKTLKELSGSESVLSQNQPGFFYGNIKSSENPDEKVIGYFEVSSVSSKRIFFNFHDVFPIEPIPKYPYNCEVDPLKPTDDPEHFLKLCFGLPPECVGPTLISGLQNNTICYFNHNGNIYEIYKIECGDCTSFASNIRPSFWID